MKQRKCDWVLRLIRFNESDEKIVIYVDILDSTKSEAMEIANDYADRYEFVRLYKFDRLI